MPEECDVIWATIGFWIAGLGSKVLLGFWCVWLVLPTEPECSRCDGFTTRIEARRGLRTLYRWCRIQDRWCPRCGEHFLARGAPPPELYVGEWAATDDPEPVTPPHTLVRRSQ